MDGGRRILRWALPAAGTPALPQEPDAVVTLADLCAGPRAFSAAFLVSGSPTACKGVLRSAMGEVEVHGVPGTTLSGVALRQHGFVGPAASKTQPMNAWRASVTARFP